MSELPQPLVPPECDCTDLDGFMLNVERLMASELVALSTHEEIAAALFLWCRAWKQIPAASLPDDDRILASFARISEKKFKKIKNVALRGFVLCCDKRLYHRVLSVEAKKAFERKIAFKNHRLKDTERMRKWRLLKDDVTRYETPNETHNVTCHEREGQGQGHKKERKKGAASGSADAALPELPSPFPDSSRRFSSNGNGAANDEPAADAGLYQRGMEVFGPKSGGLVKKLLVAKNGSIPLARAAIEQASTKADPREYIGAIINKGAASNTIDSW